MFFTLEAENGRMFHKIKNIMGQPAAIETDTLDDARKFKSREAAEEFRAKWLGTGAAMERFKQIHGR